MKIKIEIQHFMNCPNSPILIERVKEAIKDFNEIDFTETIIETNEKAKEINFRGSHTLLTNEVDFENQPVPENPNLSCRFYQNGLPSLESIRNRIVTNNNS